LIRRLVKAAFEEVGIQPPDGSVVDASLGAGVRVLVISPEAVWPQRASLVAGS